MRIGVVGCGWLGLPLAESLAKNGHTLLGSTTQESKLTSIAEKGIDPILFKLDPMPMGKDFNRLFQVDLLIVNIPPGRKRNTPEFYEEQIKYLKYQLQTSTVKEVVFVSSTSYYPNINEIVDTETLSDLTKGSSKAIVQGEKQISQIEQDLVILRCGGLMGANRIPGKWFAGKPTKGFNNPVNYIHQQDVIRIISELIENWPDKDAKKVLNLVSPVHPTRKEVHEAMAKKYGFESPIWEELSSTPSKIVDSDFKYSNLKSPLDY